MPRQKKLSYHKLSKLLEEEKLTNTVIRSRMVSYNEEAIKLRAKMQERIDQSMIESRIKLAEAVAKLIGASTEAVKWIVAKEAL